MILDVFDGEPVNFSQSFSCPDCGISIEEVEPRSFSFNNLRACPECFGLGIQNGIDEDLMIPDKSLSIKEGAIAVLGCSPAPRREAFPGRSWTPWPKSTILTWILPLRIIPKRSTIS